MRTRKPSARARARTVAESRPPERRTIALRAADWRGDIGPSCEVRGAGRRLERRSDDLRDLEFGGNTN